MFGIDLALTVIFILLFEDGTFFFVSVLSVFFYLFKKSELHVAIVFPFFGHLPGFLFSSQSISSFTQTFNIKQLEDFNTLILLHTNEK